MSETRRQGRSRLVAHNGRIEVERQTPLSDDRQRAAFMALVAAWTDVATSPGVNETWAQAFGVCAEQLEALLATQPKETP